MKYIDVDALLSKLPDDLPYKASVKRVLIQAPTVDVVPKSEYDAVVSAVDNSTKEFLKLHDDYQEAKREVERLENILNSYALQYGTVKDQHEVIEKAKADEVEVVRCKECKHWRDTSYDTVTEPHWGECRKPLGDYRYCETAEKDFCSYGERKE